MNAQQAPTGLRRSERLSKMKKSTNRKSAASPSEPTKQGPENPTAMGIGRKEPETTEPSDNRAQLLVRHKELKRTTLNHRGRLNEIKHRREALKRNHPSKIEKFQRILFNRYRIARTAVSHIHH
jgi:hypothetical protein